MPHIPLTDEEYREYAQNRPELPLWQSLEWKSYQEALGRKTRLYGLISEDSKVPRFQDSKPLNLQTFKPSNLLAAALIIIDRTAFGLSTWDIPRGPTGNPEYFGELLSGIIQEAKKERCMAIYFSPTEKVSGVRCQAPETYNLKPSRRHEQPEATVIIDLTKSDEEILKNMHEKGRYNIRLAERHGVLVEPSTDIDAFYALLQQTGKRDRYGIKPKSHYEKFLTLPESFLLLAYDSADSQKRPPFASGGTEAAHSEATVGKALAGLMGVISGETGIYYYGASDHTGRAKMAPSLLQFEAMKFCRAHGATRYDLFGIDPPINTGTGAAMNRASASTELNTGSASSGSWAGVTRFKKQFGGSTVTYPPEQEVILMPIAKKLIEWKRKIQ